MFKQWFLKTFFRNRILLENILLEIRNVHYHLDRIESFYMMVNKIEMKKEEVKEEVPKNKK